MNPINLLPRSDTLPQWKPEDNNDELMSEEVEERKSIIDDKISLFEYKKMFERQKTRKPITVNVKYDVPWNKYFLNKERELGLTKKKLNKFDEDKFDLVLPKHKLSPRESFRIN